MELFLKTIAIIFLSLVSHSVSKTTTVVKRHNINDQAVSGSGYSYSLHSGDPGAYQKGRSLEILEDLGYNSKLDYKPDVERYGKKELDNIDHLPLVNKEYNHNKFVDDNDPTKYDDYKFNVNNVLYHSPHAHGWADDGYVSYPYAPGYKHHYPYDYEPHYPIYEDHFEDSDFLKHKNYQDDDFSKKNGKEYDEENYSKDGEETKKGYNKEDKFEKGLKGKHDNFDKQSYYGEKGGHKDSHHDQKGHYDEHYSKGGSNKGEDYGEKAGHKKGQQTKGYHKVLHKDEFKKEHKFYDQADKKGYYDKYGNFKKHHGSEEGAFKKGGSYDSGSEKDKFGKKEMADKGQYDKKDEGFKGEQGQEEYYKDFSDYGSKKDQSEEKEGGYKHNY